jgi:hypothetical protein
MPNCNVLDVLVFATNVANSRFQTTWKPSFVCFEFYPAVVELSDTISLLFMSGGLRETQEQHKVLTRDCQLSSMIKLLMLISFLANSSRALNIFSSVKSWPIPFQVQ